MSAPARKLATYQDVLDAPEGVVAEVVHGVLHTMPRPRPRHARTSSQLGVLLGGPFDVGVGGPGGWVILDEPELHLGADILVPDLAAWKRDRFPFESELAFIEVVPDWICEVLTASTSAFGRTEKLGVYAREGVRHAWLIEPDSELLEASALDSGRWVRVGAWHGVAVVNVPPFDAVPLALDRLWLKR